jgi:Tfp pilus assembly protein PilN
MIRINLLGVPRKVKGGKRPSAPSMPGEGSSTVVLVIAFMGLLAVAIGGTYWYVVKTLRPKLEQELHVAMVENQHLAEVKAKYEASQRKADMFKRRLKVIDDLKEAQKGPFELLNRIADTVNKTDAVWLEAMTDDGKAIDFTGMALSADAVADLMANLRKSGAFKSVEIKETSQDSNIKELQAFKFELICEKSLTGKVQAKES